jgi:uncharacterized protein YndB with AHSA1/START domain
MDDLGQLAPDGARWRLTFRRFLPHPPEKVWRAITEPEHLAAWFPARIDGERRDGAALRFVFEGGEGPTTDGVITVFDPPSVLEFTWGPEVLRFVLTAEPGGTGLRFVNTFDEVGKAARDGAGWHVCLDRLAADLGGRAQPDGQVEQWKAVHDRYVAAFGPEATTIGVPDTHAEYR